MRHLALPVLIIVEDDACLEPSLFLKARVPAYGLAVFPKTGHVINLEEPDLFNSALRRFLPLAEWGVGHPRSCLTPVPALMDGSWTVAGLAGPQPIPKHAGVCVGGRLDRHDTSAVPAGVV